MFTSFIDVRTVLVVMGFTPVAEDKLVYAAGSIGNGYRVTVSYKHIPLEVRRDVNGKVISYQRRSDAYTIESSRWDCNWDDGEKTTTQVVDGHMRAFKAIVEAL